LSEEKGVTGLHPLVFTSNNALAVMPRLISWRAPTEGLEQGPYTPKSAPAFMWGGGAGILPEKFVKFYIAVGEFFPNPRL